VLSKAICFISVEYHQSSKEQSVIIPSYFITVLVYIILLEKQL